MSYNVVNQSTGDLEQIAGSTLTAIYADSPLGVILPFGGTVAPTGFLICDGSAVSRSDYADLYAVIGTKFGPGDGSTTFNLPTNDFGANLYPNVESKYIIKAVQTALPSDFQSALDEKQDIVDDALDTTSKEITGAINEVNAKLISSSSKVLTSHKGITCIATKIGHVVTLLFGGSATETIPANEVLFSLTGALATNAAADVFVSMANINGQRIILGQSSIYMAGPIEQNVALRGSVTYPANNYDQLT